MCILCDTGEDDDVDHTVLRCDSLKQPRGTLSTEAQTIPALIQKALKTEEDWLRFTRRISCIMKKKEALYRKRQNEAVRNQLSTSTQGAS